MEVDGETLAPLDGARARVDADADSRLSTTSLGSAACNFCVVVLLNTVGRYEHLYFLGQDAGAEIVQPLEERGGDLEPAWHQ